MRLPTRGIVQPRINIIMASSCILSVTDGKDICRSRPKLFCPPLHKTISPCSNGSAFLPLQARPSSPTKSIVTIRTGAMREKSKTMNCSLLSRPLRVQLKKKSRGTRLRMTFILPSYPPSESPWRPSTAGLSIKQTFKELKSAGQRPDCLYTRLVNLPSRSFS